LDPHNPSFHDSLGSFLFYQEKRTDEALKEWPAGVEESRRAVSRDPNNPKLHLALAHALHSLPVVSAAEAGRNLNEAIAELKAASLEASAAIGTRLTALLAGLARDL